MASGFNTWTEDLERGTMVLSDEGSRYLLKDLFTCNKLPKVLGAVKVKM